MITDKRQLWSNGRVAHESLRDLVDAETFTSGTLAQVSSGKTPLLSAPDGTRERELLFGEPFNVLETRDGFAFGYALRDGYAGYVASGSLHDQFRQPTHVIDAARSYLKGSPDLKAYEPVFDLSFGSFVEVLEEKGSWAGVAIRFRDEPGKLWTNWMPKQHLRPIDQQLDDPVEVASRFLGTPYLWGGNSGFGIDCSGLVQAACLACGWVCPGDSDQQQASLGQHLPSDAPLQRGDILFWKGHVAWVSDPATILHANAHHMAVAYEPLDLAISRIASKGDGPVTARKRLEART